MTNLITLDIFILLICNKRRFYNTNSLSTILLSCWHCARDPIAALCARSYHTPRTRHLQVGAIQRKWRKTQARVHKKE